MSGYNPISTQPGVDDAPVGAVKINTMFAELYPAVQQFLYLEQAGAVGNGTTDDTAAINAAFATFATAPNYGKVIGQAGKTYKITSGLTIIAGCCAFDGQGCTFNASTMTSGYAFSILPNPASPYTQYVAPFAIGNFSLVGPSSNTNNADGLFIGRNSGGGSVSQLSLRNITIIGFRDNMYWGNQVYISKIYNMHLFNAWRYGLNYTATTNAGENMSWHGGQITACISGTSTPAVAIYMPNTGGGDNELYLFAVSIDTNDQVAQVFGGVLELHSCVMYENANTSTAPTFLIQGFSGSLPTGVRLFGGTYQPNPTPVKSVLIDIDATANVKTFFEGNLRFNLYNQGSLLFLQSGNPVIRVDDSTIDFSGSTPAGFVQIGALQRLTNPSFQSNTFPGANWVGVGTGYTFTTDTTVFYNPGSGTTDSGTATSGTSTRLVDTTKTWVVNQWVGATLTDTTQSFSVTVLQNTATTLTFGFHSAAVVAGNAYTLALTGHSGKMVSTGGNTGSISQIVACNPNSKIYIDSWYNVTAIAGGSVKVVLYFLSYDQSTQVGAQTLATATATTTGFVRAPNVYLAPDGTAFLQLLLLGTTFTGTAYLDNCAVVVT